MQLSAQHPKMQQQAHRSCTDAPSRLSSTRRRPKVRVQLGVRSGSHPLLPPLPRIATLGPQQHPKDEAEKTDTASEGEGKESDTEAEEADVHGLRLQVIVSSGLDVSDEGPQKAVWVARPRRSEALDGYFNSYDALNFTKLETTMLIGNMHFTSSSSRWYKIPRSWRRWLFVKEHRLDPGFPTSLTNSLERTGMAMGLDKHTAERFGESDAQSTDKEYS
ncbi:hypothetical protein C8R43DRAFT_1134626 [Mycena crocata]|nr:hypothetical protein C8R43DRAFT_1134626 [Mycena crocata]